MHVISICVVLQLLEIDDVRVLLCMEDTLRGRDRLGGEVSSKRTISSSPSSNADFDLSGYIDQR